MLLMMLERNEPIHSVVFFDTGWEFPEMIDHIDKLEKYTGIQVIWLKHKHSFTYVLNEKPTVVRKGPMKGQPARAGNGWPSMFRRWCTRLKIDEIERYLKQQENFKSCIGFAADESKRVPVKSKKKWPERYPLIEWDISEKEALKYCYDHGFYWGGLYELFGRVSCFCCPLQRIGELRNLRTHRPELWAKMLKMDTENCRGFRDMKTVHDLDRRFAEEDRQMDLFPETVGASNLESTTKKEK
jgi:3'-phosphoadenosine 5'-phosphosulfate sulfotransferase (PAPS reductase)/FAD synthetase